ncbi:MAG: response regulator, partial [Fibrella sp.]|nr:response regulator [Armatimonadota bacterium]
MKVLIAEDDSTSAIVLRKALEKLGHEAVVATDGEQAYTLLTGDTAFEYRVVISDWMMPGMDGLELTRKLREERESGDPYRFVILLTARGRPEDRRAGLEAGADDFMVKPMDMGDLIPRLSIAERMLRLEDAVSAKVGSPPAPHSRGARGEGTGESRSAVAPNALDSSAPVPSVSGGGGIATLPGEVA